MVDHSSSDIDMVDFDAADASSPGGFGVRRTAYLSRRMAALPQPSNKLVIKPFKAKPALPSNFEENTWAILKPAISSIFRNQPPTGELEILYQAVTDLCVHKMSGSLYQQIKRECEAHISTALRSLSDQIQIKPMTFLSAVENSWKDFSEQMQMICSIASHLDRTYVKQDPNMLSVWDMGLQIFRNCLSREVVNKTVHGLLQMIKKERSGKAADMTQLKYLVKMFTDLGIYLESFQEPFLEGTSEFYAAEGLKYMEQKDVPDYLKHVEERLCQERDRCVRYLDARTRKPLLARARKQLLECHITAILDKGFVVLMEEKRIEDLERMYVLFSRVNALESLQKALGSYIHQKGQGIVMDEEKDKDMVLCLLDLKASVDTILENSFSKNTSFHNTIKNAFGYLINVPKLQSVMNKTVHGLLQMIKKERSGKAADMTQLKYLVKMFTDMGIYLESFQEPFLESRPVELIAKFLDEKLGARNKGTSEELDDTLDSVLVLFRFIQGKDVFEAYYKKDLAKRLLLGKSASIDTEKSIISKLKDECGSQFTFKLEGMLKDIELSKEINKSFKQSPQAMPKLSSGIEMSVHVLTTGNWPTYAPMDVRLPHELNVHQDMFKKFYSKKYRNRRLVWPSSLGHCVLKAEFANGRKELIASLFQTVVLMLFNDTEKLNFKEIKEATNIEDKELRRTLQSLACENFRILQKLSEGREVDDNDSLTFNNGFTDNHYRIKVNAFQMKETVEENTSITKQVFQDRRYQVDAAITRIMKANKTLSHSLLITELEQTLGFPMKRADLKARIESLIERVYLERDPDNPEVYKYLA